MVRIKDCECSPYIEHADQPPLPDPSSGDIFRENKKISSWETQPNNGFQQGLHDAEALTEDIIDRMSAQLQSMSLQVISSMIKEEISLYRGELSSCYFTYITNSSSDSRRITWKCVFHNMRDKMSPQL